MLIINFEGREAKGLSKGRYDETFAGEDGWLGELPYHLIFPQSIQIFLAHQIRISEISPWDRKSYLTQWHAI